MYCINCGVELADSETVCPLCGTRVFHPDMPRQQGEPPFPPDPMGHPEEVNRSGVLFILTMLAVLPLWFRRPNPVIFVPADFAAIGLYLLYINFATGGHWFLTFGLHHTFIWSFYPLAAGVLLGAMLLIIAVCKPLRRSLHRKFFL